MRPEVGAGTSRSSFVSGEVVEASNVSMSVVNREDVRVVALSLLVPWPTKNPSVVERIQNFVALLLNVL